jgi:hypothetical protein
MQILSYGIFAAVDTYEETLTKVYGVNGALNFLLCALLLDGLAKS